MDEHALALSRFLGDARARRWSAGLEQAILATTDPERIAVVLSEVVTSRLGDRLVEPLFYEVSTALVIGLRLASGARVVIKVYAPACSVEYLRAVRRVQAALSAAGYPAPRPLAGPFRVGAGSAVVDEFLPVASSSERADPEARRQLARGLADFIERCAALPHDAGLRHPPFPWPPGGLWGLRVRPEIDLHARPKGAEWIDDLARRGLRLASAGAGREVIGHADWLPHNVRLEGGVIVAVFDWDSVCVAPEPVFVGRAIVWGPVDDALEFRDAYERARGAALRSPEWRLALGVAVWMRAFLARWEHATAMTGTGLRDNLATTGESMLALAERSAGGRSHGSQ